MMRLWKRVGLPLFLLAAFLCFSEKTGYGQGQGGTFGRANPPKGGGTMIKRPATNG